MHLLVREGRILSTDTENRQPEHGRSSINPIPLRLGNGNTNIATSAHYTAGNHDP